MRMHTLLFMSLILVVAATATGQDAAKDREKLQGPWVIIALEIDGRQMIRDERPKLVIRGERFKIEEQNRETVEGTFTINPPAKPSACEVMERSHKYLGIYELEGNTLKICLGSKRPDTFTTGPDSNRIFLVCQRVVEQPKAELVKKELARVRGTWTLVLAIVEGKKTADQVINDERNQKTFGDGRFSIKRVDQPGRTTEAAYTLDPTTTPNAIDIVPAEGPDRGKVCRGIYQLEKESLTLCIAAPGFNRPKDFSAPAGSGCVLTVYKREKP